MQTMQPLSSSSSLGPGCMVLTACSAEIAAGPSFCRVSLDARMCSRTCTFHHKALQSPKNDLKGRVKAPLVDDSSSCCRRAVSRLEQPLHANLLMDSHRSNACLKCHLLPQIASVSLSLWLQVCICQTALCSMPGKGSLHRCKALLRQQMICSKILLQIIIRVPQKPRRLESCDIPNAGKCSLPRGF